MAGGYGVAIEKQPFRMYKDEDEINKEKAKSSTLTIRLNAEEQKILKELKHMFSLTSDGTAIKLSMQVGYNVLHSFLGSKTMRYLTQERRVREL